MAQTQMLNNSASCYALNLTAAHAAALPSGISLGLGLNESFFEGQRAGDSYWCMRVIHYPPLTAASEPSDASLPVDGEIERSVQLSCGEHTDYGAHVDVAGARPAAARRCPPRIGCSGARFAAATATGAEACTAACRPSDAREPGAGYYGSAGTASSPRCSRACISTAVHLRLIAAGVPRALLSSIACAGQKRTGRMGVSTASAWHSRLQHRRLLEVLDKRRVHIVQTWNDGSNNRSHVHHTCTCMQGNIRARHTG